MRKLPQCLNVSSKLSGSPSGAQNRILQGKNATLGQFPYQVSIQIKKFFYDHLCGGSIVNKRVIITAAHCLVGVKPQQLKVATGTVLVDEGDLYDVEKIVIHEKYTGKEESSLIHDIALLRTSNDIKFNENAQPVALATPDHPMPSKAMVSGWGYIHYVRVPGHEQIKWPKPEILQYLQVNVLSNEECQKNQERYKIYPSQVCTLNKIAQGICNGDSGGPLVADGRLFGIVSWGIPCAVGIPDVFTRVSSYSDWINEKMAELA